MATFPHHYTSPLERCVIRVDDNWYDLTTWRHSHPGGAELIDQFNNRDATEAFYSLHSQEAVAKMHKMKATPVDEKDSPRDPMNKNFERLRMQLRKDGFYNRSWAIDFLYWILPCMVLFALGSYYAYSHPIISILLLGLGFQQSGWLGHDYMHGRGPFVFPVGVFFGNMVCGFSRGWWSHKHNTHHTFPNRKEYDSDIHNEPILHLWFPKEGSDVWYRKYQHLYYLPVFSLLLVSWRIQSIQFVAGSRDWGERIAMLINYCWLATLPWYVAFFGILVGGLCVAVVVTANHQTEPILESDAPMNFVRDQFTTTRGVLCGNLLSEWFFGGMQYQLEHHLFPSMPRQHFPKLRPIVKKFAEENGMKYHMSNVSEIMKLNYNVYYTYSQEAKSGIKAKAH